MTSCDRVTPPVGRSPAAHRESFEAMLDEHPVRRAVLEHSWRPGWISDWLALPPDGPGHTFADEVDDVRALGRQASSCLPAREHARALVAAHPQSAGHGRAGGPAARVGVDARARHRLGPPRARAPRRHRLAHSTAGHPRLGGRAARPRARPRVARRRPAADQPLRPAVARARRRRRPLSSSPRTAPRPGSAGTCRGATPSTTPSPVRSRRSTARPTTVSSGSSAPPAPGCCARSTARRARARSSPAPVCRSARSVTTSRSCSPPARCCAAARGVRCSTGAPRSATPSSPRGRRRRSGRGGTQPASAVEPTCPRFLVKICTRWIMDTHTPSPAPSSPRLSRRALLATAAASTVVALTAPLVVRRPALAGARDGRPSRRHPARGHHVRPGHDLLRGVARRRPHRHG